MRQAPPSCLGTAPQGSRDPVAAVRRAVEEAVDGRAGPLLLAVSGGRDSLAMLDACAASSVRARVAAVATFDHGTGEHAREAAAAVQRAAAAHGFPCIAGRADFVAHTEAGWRVARWRFLTRASRDAGGTAIAVAHTRDDALETIVLRLLRRAGPRGLAGLDAASPRVVRPLLAVGRAEVAAYAKAVGITPVDDPANADRAHARVRVRLDLLPALARVDPDAGARLRALGRAAATWRTAVERWADTLAAPDADRRISRVAVLSLAGLSDRALATFWPVLAARAGVRLDRRAIVRLVDFTGQAVKQIADGTVQPRQVPVAGGGTVRLRPHARAWWFVVDASAAIDPALGTVDCNRRDY